MERDSRCRRSFQKMKKRLLRHSKTINQPVTAEGLRFAEEYILDLNVDAASARAGISSSRGRGFLQNIAVQSAIQMAKARRASRTEIYADEVLRRWWLLATADAREFTQVHWVNCRYCWGVEHQYQYRDHELIEAERRHNELIDALPEEKRRDAKDFNPLGGGGFDGDRDPCRGDLAIERMIAAGLSNVPEPNSDHNCPACDGRGQKSVWVNDSRFYSQAGALLYDGVKVSKDGSMEIKLRDREHAEDMIAQHLGMLVHRTVNLDLDPTKLTDEQLNGLIERFAALSERDGAPLLEHAPQGARET